MAEPGEISIRTLATGDCGSIASAFTAQKWNKPVQLFERYLNECSTGKRSILIAEIASEFTGYLTIDWCPQYPPFKRGSIPEIADFNVLIKFQKQGVGSRLMDAAEQQISERSDIAGIRVGLTADYGSAQRLYVQRGYIPDGRGISQRSRFLKYGDTLVVDDDLNVAFTKSLR